MSSEPFSNHPEHFTLAEAAKLLKVSIPTARRLIASGKMEALKVKVGDRPRWEIPRAEVFRMLQEDFKESVECFNEASENAMKASEAIMNPAFSEPLHDSVPLATLTLALEHSAELLKQLIASQAAMERERIAREQADRSAEILRMHLQQHQRVMSEQAESLMVERARVLQIEAQLSESLERPDKAQFKHQTEKLKLDLPTPERGWGARVKRLLFRKLG